jgi:hypothetical protein
MAQQTKKGSSFGTSSYGTVTWTSPGNASTSNDVWTYASLAPGLYTYYLKVTGFGFTIPTGYIINWVKVRIERHAGGTDIKDYVVKLIKGGTIQGDNKASATGWPASDANEDHNGGTKWGLTLLYSDVNATNFGVAIVAKNNSASATLTAYIDYVEITIDYSPPWNQKALSIQTTNILTLERNIDYATTVILRPISYPAVPSGYPSDFFNCYNIPVPSNSTHWVNVDETECNGDTDYMEGTPTYNGREYYYYDHSGLSGEIIDIQLKACWKCWPDVNEDGALAFYFERLIEDVPGYEEFEGYIQAGPALSYKMALDTVRPLNVFTGVKWTWDDFDNIGMGIETSVIESTQKIRFSQMFIVVRYFPEEVTLQYKSLSVIMENILHFAKNKPIKRCMSFNQFMRNSRRIN